jgi:hypothetical protein
MDSVSLHEIKQFGQLNSRTLSDAESENSPVGYELSNGSDRSSTQELSCGFVVYGQGSDAIERHTCVGACASSLFKPVDCGRHDQMPLLRSIV